MAKENKNEQENKNKLELLMADIDSKVAEFCKLTGVKGKAVKKRWRDIKKQSAHEIPDDKITELEKAIRDYYVSKGYVVGDGTWEFQISFISEYNTKQLLVFLAAENAIHTELDMQGDTTKELLAETLKYFNDKTKKLNRCVLS